MVEVFYLSHCQSDSHWCHFDFKVVSHVCSSLHFLFFPAEKSCVLLITASWAFQAEGRSDESDPSQIYSPSNTWQLKSQWGSRSATETPHSNKPETLINQMTNASLEAGVLFFYHLPYFDLHQIKFPHLRRGDLDVDDDGGEGSLPQLWRVVNGVSVQNDQL